MGIFTKLTQQDSCWKWTNRPKDTAQGWVLQGSKESDKTWDKEKDSIISCLSLPASISGAGLGIRKTGW